MRPSLLALTLSLGVGVAAALPVLGQDSVPLAPFADSDIHALVTLPTAGLKAVQLADGRLLLMSIEGRYVISGRIFDTRLGRELQGFEDLRTSVDTIGADLAARLDVDAMAPVRVGQGPIRLLVFVDPLCPACHQLVSELRALATTTTALLLPVPASDASNEVIRHLHCALDPAAAQAALLDGVDTADVRARALALPQRSDVDCDTAPLVHRLLSAQLLDVRQVPFVIAPDGRISRGAPHDLYRFAHGG